MMRRLVLLALLFAAPAHGQTPIIELLPGGRFAFAAIDGLLDSDDLMCVTSSTTISVGGVCNALGGTGGGPIESSGASLTSAACIDEVVATIDGEATVETTTDLPAGSAVRQCVTRTNATTDGGYLIGLAGAEDMFGAAGGTIGNTNLADATLPLGTRIYVAEPVVLTSAHSSGEYQDSDGEIRVVCFCDEMEAPDE